MQLIVAIAPNFNHRIQTSSTNTTVFNSLNSHPQKPILRHTSFNFSNLVSLCKIPPNILHSDILVTMRTTHSADLLIYFYFYHPNEHGRLTVHMVEKVDSNLRKLRILKGSIHFYMPVVRNVDANVYLQEKCV
jgi:hypothetical protein